LSFKSPTPETKKARQLSIKTAKAALPEGPVRTRTPAHGTKGREGKAGSKPKRYKPSEHGDRERASRFPRHSWIGRTCRSPKLCLDGFTVEKNEPPDTDQKGHP